MLAGVQASNHASSRGWSSLVEAFGDEDREKSIFDRAVVDTSPAYKPKKVWIMQNIKAMRHGREKEAQ